MKQYPRSQPPTSSVSSSNLWPPTVSIIIPTLNSAKTLGDCLDSIARQDYPKDKIEVIVADGGSTDGTLEIISEFSGASNPHPQTSNVSVSASNLQPPTSNRSFSASNLKPQTLNIQIVPNNLKTGEAGKAVGGKVAKNEVIAFIDSDNVLPENGWLKRMVEPLEDPEIIGSEPLYYTYRKEDGFITRYCALLGMNDPLCLFLGNYDRYSALTGKWTEMPHSEEDKGNYLKVALDKKQLPTIGANGFLICRSALLSAFASNLQPQTSNLSPSNLQPPPSNVSVSASNLDPPTSNLSLPDYLFDIDIVYELLNSTSQTSSVSPIRFAKVKTGIIHIFSGDMKTFSRKQRRRIKDYLYYSKLGVRKYPWENVNRADLIKFILSCLTVFPLLVQSLKGYIKRPDRAWFFHPIACYLTLWEYGRGRIGGIFGVGELRRERWRQ